jgi:hypothetical protein
MFLVQRNRAGVQTYVLLAIKPHRRRDGSLTTFAVWGSNCRECGEPFETTSGTSKTAIGKGLAVRCKAHRRPGRK